MLRFEPMALHFPADQPDQKAIPFHDVAGAQVRLESLKTRVSPEVLSSVFSLLAESPDPDGALNLLERLVANNSEAAVLLDRYPQLIHYAASVFGHSRYLGETVLQNTDLLSILSREDRLSRSYSQDDFQEAWARFRARSLEPNPDLDIAMLLARFKRREYVRILLRDVLKIATLAEISAEISALSDVLIGEALRQASGKLREKYGPAQHLDDAGRTVETPFTVLSLGKLGGNELNYSSDVDLMYVYGEEQSVPGAVISNQEYFVRLAQEVTQTLSRVTQEGPVFRIDMRLRPQGAEGELALSQKQMRTYYSETAQDWELQALIKIRYSAGDEALARECIRGVQPFVYRGAVDGTEQAVTELSFSAIETALQARERMVAKRRPSPMAADTIDVKLDRGGIRDIEFLAQCLQRVHGGREVWLRSRGTLFALQKLHDKNHIGGRDFQELTETYEFFRQVEHRLQLRTGQQTHRLPSSPEELRVIQRALAGHAVLQHGLKNLQEALQERMAGVTEIYRRIIHHQQWRKQEESLTAEFELRAGRENLGELPYQMMLDRLAQDSPQIFMLARETEQGSLRRRSLQRFLSSVFTSSARYAVLLRYPEAFARALELFEASGYLTDVLVRYPEECATLAEIGSRTPTATGYLFAPPSRWESPPSDPVFQFVATANSSDTEKLALLRRHCRHLSFVSGVRDLMELRPVYQSLSAQSAMAEDAISAAFTLAGQPEGLAVLALGRLGAGEFDVFSDADLIFVRDEILPYETAKKAVEQMVHALAAYTREGMVFPVDARLRPRGGEGELVITPAALGTYCEIEAQAWEALTYPKLRFLCGMRRVAEDVVEETEKIFTRFRSARSFASEVNEMRGRLEQLDTARNWKSSSGGIYDIDFLTGYLLVKEGLSQKGGSLRDRLWRLADAGILSKSEAGDLDHAAELLRTVEHVAGLVVGRAQKWLPATGQALEATERWTAGVLRRTFSSGLEHELEVNMGLVRQIYHLRLQ
jgi:[glutamine synthetase] adenylyltransferase / [glutamine synthetase]-adenylyl-L-tyrosine phosphorylase